MHRARPVRTRPCSRTHPGPVASSLVGERYEVEVGAVAQAAATAWRAPRGPRAVRTPRPARREDRRPGHRGRGRLALPAGRRGADPEPVQGPGRGPRAPSPDPASAAAATGSTPSPARSAASRARSSPSSSSAGRPHARGGGLGRHGRCRPRATSSRPARSRRGAPACSTPSTTRASAGLRKHRSHDVQLIDHCMIASPGVTELGIEKREWPQLASVEAIAAIGLARPPGRPDTAAGRQPAPGGTGQAGLGPPGRGKDGESTGCTAAPSSASAPTAAPSASAGRLLAGPPAGPRHAGEGRACRA